MKLLVDLGLKMNSLLFQVEDSMENLEDVVRERNVAYFQLETTHSGERPAELIDNVFGK